MTRSNRTAPAAPEGGDGLDQFPAEWDVEGPPVTFEEFRARGQAAKIFESDEEIDEFIAWVHAERRQDTA